MSNDSDGLYKCYKCLHHLPIDRFVKAKGKRGVHYVCKECNNAAGRERYRKNRLRYSMRARETKYGLTSEEMHSMYDTQSGKCAICLRPIELHTDFANRDNSLHVDHDHTTGKVRGLLCSHCNIGIGSFFDSVTLLQRASDYLKDFASE